jgi:hypothetical protein
MGEIQKMDYKPTKSFSVGSIIAVIIGLIMLIAVAIPVTQDVVTSANLTGTASTVVNLLPLLLAVGGVILVAALYQTR